MALFGKSSLKETLNIEELYNRFLGLDEQQRTLTIVGIVVVLLLLIIIPVTCASSKLSQKEKKILNHSKNMDELVSKILEYQKVENKMKQMETQWAGRSKISISTTLESLSAQSGLDKNIDTIKEQTPSAGDIFDQHSADVRLSRVGLSQLLDYLYKIESFQQGALKVDKLQLHPRYDNRQLFDVSFTVSTYAIKEGANS